MLENKFGLVLGVANKRSIAWAISRAAATHGARLALTYQGERLLGGGIIEGPWPPALAGSVPGSNDAHLAAP